jgi:ribonuclease-3
LSEEKAALEIAGYRFNDAELLTKALTHSSYVTEHPSEGTQDYERLEFLGDAVLGVVIGEELYRRFPRAKEGKLTTLRATLVWRGALAELGRSLGLPDRARLGRGEEESGGRARTSLAASLYEAFVGAVYLDGGLDRAKRLVLDIMRDPLQQIEESPPISVKNVLHLWAQSEHVERPVYQVLETTGPQHQKGYVVEARVADKVAQGTGSSKREAEEAAAAKLLEMIKP